MDPWVSEWSIVEMREGNLGVVIEEEGDGWVVGKVSKSKQTLKR